MTDSIDIAQDLPDDVKRALDRFMAEEKIDATEAVRRIICEWLIGNGYLPIDEDDE